MSAAELPSLSEQLRQWVLMDPRVGLVASERAVIREAADRLEALEEVARTGREWADAEAASVEAAARSARTGLGPDHGVYATHRTAHDAHIAALAALGGSTEDTDQ